jgi:hypothetical protein
MMMTSRRLTQALLLAGAIFASGCGDDLGTADYSGHDELLPPNQKFEEPDPFQIGKDRLSVEAFYEGGRTTTIKVNGFRTHFFIFGGPELGRDTFTLAAAGDRLEGEQSHRITLVGTPWWGGGIVWDQPINLSEWKKLFVSFKSSARSFATFELSLLSGEGDTPRSVVLDPTDYGYTNDGEWHSLEIDLQDAIARGFDPTRVRSPFVVGAPGGKAGDWLLVDNLYLTKF